MRHKHADLIHAWAEGAVIEVKYKGLKGWSIIKSPTWIDEYEYRIKPETKQPVVRWKWAVKRGRTWVELESFATEEEANQNTGLVKLEYTRTEFPV